MRELYRRVLAALTAIGAGEAAAKFFACAIDAPTAAAVCRRLGVPQRSLTSVFFRAGMKFGALVDDAQLARLGGIIVQPTITHARAAQAAQFSSPQSAYRFVARLTGMRPSVWRDTCNTGGLVADFAPRWVTAHAEFWRAFALPTVRA